MDFTGKLNEKREKKKTLRSLHKIFIVIANALEVFAAIRLAFIEIRRIDLLPTFIHRN